MKTLIDILKNRADKSNSYVEFYPGSEKFSYFDFYKKAQIVACNLQQIGIKKGDRVGLILPTHPNFYFAFFGAQLIGAVPFSLFPPMRLTEFRKWKKDTLKLIEIADAKVMITEGRFLKNSLNIKNLVEGPINPISVCLNENDEAFVQFSSGTTGTPKLISISHKNIVSNCHSIIKAFVPYHQGTLTVSWLPLYHDMGLIGGALTPMVAETNLILIPPEIFIASPVTWPEVISSRKAEISIGPNFAYGLCSKKITDEQLKGLDLTCWKVALCGAETVVPKTMNDFISKFQKVGLNPNILTPVYGLAEATLAVSFSDILSPMKGLEFDKDLLELKNVVKTKKGGMKLYSVGRPLDGIEISIRKGTQDLESGVGIIWVKGPNVGNGQIWISTGDRGFLYENELYICGREKEIIIIRGRNIDPSTIEKPINELVEVRTGTCVAFGVNNIEDGTESLYICVETKFKNKDLKNKISQTAYKSAGIRPAKVYLFSPRSIPKTSSGKIKRLKTKEMIEKKWSNLINLKSFFR